MSEKGGQHKAAVVSQCIISDRLSVIKATNLSKENKKITPIVDFAENVIKLILYFPPVCIS
jgi:hypothetical protein